MFPFHPGEPNITLPKGTPLGSDSKLVMRLDGARIAACGVTKLDCWALDLLTGEWARLADMLQNHAYAEKSHFDFGNEKLVVSGGEIRIIMCCRLPESEVTYAVNSLFCSREANLVILILTRGL